MSVRSDLRGKTKLAVLESAKKLSEHTLRKCTNNDIFPLRFRNSIINRLTGEAMDIVINISKAHYTPTKTLDDYKKRREYQIEARGHLQALLALIDLAYKMFGNLTGKMVDYWTGLCEQTEKELLDWMIQDNINYSKLKEKNK